MGHEHDLVSLWAKALVYFHTKESIINLSLHQATENTITLTYNLLNLPYISTSEC